MQDRGGILSAFAESPGSQPNETTATTRIVLPFRHRIVLDAPGFVADYARDWGGRLAITELRGTSPGSGGSRRYRFTERTESLILVVHDRPIPRTVVETTLEATLHSA